MAMAYHLTYLNFSIHSALTGHKCHIGTGTIIPHSVIKYFIKNNFHRKKMGFFDFFFIKIWEFKFQKHLNKIPMIFKILLLENNLQIYFL